jgi:hypothetical protein
LEQGGGTLAGVAAWHPLRRGFISKNPHKTDRLNLFYRRGNIFGRVE